MRLHDLRFLLILALPLLGLASMWRDPAGAFVGTLVIWWGIALAEALWPGGRWSPPPVPVNTPQGYFTGIVWAYVLLQITLLMVGSHSASKADWAVILGLGFGVGFITGAQGITLAHELGHSKQRFSRCLAWLLMTSVCYGHFMVEHYRGHHPRAATPADPASARRGESLYRFWLRTLSGSWRSAWRLEAEQLRRLGKSWWRSPLVWSVAGSLAMAAGVSLYFSAYSDANKTQSAIKIIAFLGLQSAVAVLLLETVNYIEHYGLTRQSLADGVNTRPEAFGVQHAWNADHVISNSLLANLQRHSDHHLHAWKPYATLQALPGPQLPTGYAGAILLAAVPPLWFRLMEPRLERVDSTSKSVL